MRDAIRPLLFFDLDDTLVDHRGAEAAAQEETFGAFPQVFAGLVFEEWLATYRKLNLSFWDAYGRGEMGREALQSRRFREPLKALGRDSTPAAEVGGFYLSRYREHWKLVEGAEELLEGASRLGLVGLLSNGFKEQQRRKIRRFDLDRWATIVILSEDVSAMKPDRRIFEAAARAAGAEAAGGVDGSPRVYVGDSYFHDVVGARNAGWTPILYNPSGATTPEPVREVRALAEILPILRAI